MSFRRILVAVDEGPIAARAVDVAIDLARSLAAELALIHAVDPGLGRAPDTGASAAELISQAKDEGGRLLAAFRVRAAPQPPPLEFVLVGKPAAEIVKAAKEWSADVIVIGSHGRAGVTRVLLGSVAEAVMRHAPLDVLAARAPAAPAD